MLETDCPYCDIRNSHASAKYVETKFPSIKKKEKYDPEDPEQAKCIVKDRNEPCTIVQVVEVYSKLTGKSIEEVTSLAWANTLKMFRLSE
jgi:TatD DNase family protein